MIGPLSWLRLVSTVRWQHVSTEDVRDSRWALGPSWGQMAMTLLSPPKKASVRLHAITCPLYSLACP